MQGNPKTTSCVIIFLSEFLLLALVVAVLMIQGAKAYDGDCIFFRPPPIPCSFEKHMNGVMVYMPLNLIIFGLIYWWIALPLMIVFPMIGLKISAVITHKMRAGSERTNENVAM